MERRLSNFPYVRVRIGCTQCKRSADLSLARLAEKYGDETALELVLDQIAADCPWRGPSKGYGKRHVRCFAKFIDLEGRSPPPPDLPPGVMGLRLIEGGKIKAVANPGAGLSDDPRPRRKKREA